MTPRWVKVLDAVFHGWPPSVPLTFGFACGLSLGLFLGGVVAKVGRDAPVQVERE